MRLHSENSRYRSYHGDSLVSADNGHWYACANLPETHVVFGDDGPTARLTAVLLCGDMGSVSGTWCFDTEKFAVSDVLEGPKAVFALRKHPLQYTTEVS